MKKHRLLKRLVLIGCAACLVFPIYGCVDNAAAIDARIAEVKEITPDSLETLQSIESDYQSLSEEDKQRVQKYSDLQSAIDECTRKITDKNFLEALEDSVSNRMSDSGSDDYESLVNAELTRLGEYRDAEFYDETISSAAEQYFAGLDSQKEALGKTKIYSEYQVLWNKGIVERYGALNVLHDEYGFMGDNPDFVADYVIDFEKKEAFYNAMVAIENDLRAQNDAQSFTFDYPLDGHEFVITAMNNTEYAFESVWDVSTLAEDGTIVETTQASVSVQPHAQYMVHVYLSNNNWSSAQWDNWYTEIYV